jgi:hypothetical protein
MKEREKLEKENPKLYEEMMSDPGQQIFEGLDPRDLEVTPEELKLYPGTSKGAHPQDDPEFFSEWVKSNMPRAYELLMKRVNNMIQNNIDKMEDKDPLEDFKEDEKNDNNNDDNIKTDIMDASYVEGALAPVFYWQMSTLEFDLQNIMDITNVEASAPNLKDGNYSDLPMIPENLPLEWDSQVWFLQHWSEFRDSLK